MPALALASLLPAQTTLNSLSNVVNVVAPEKVVLRRGATQAVEFTVQVRNGYHVNSNKPDDEYLIPLRFTFGSDSPVQVSDVEYPKPTLEKLAFSTKPVSVFQGDIKTRATVKAGANVPAGATVLNGKLRYQACNDRMCLPPRTLDVKVPVEIRN